ncbi:MAG: aspartate carbamoyltransferase, partial [Firmicutes bacterium]|nr:aspartate carbamoyltransferase [Candidatus Colimorpha enterica]
YMRMALILKLLSDKTPDTNENDYIRGHKCRNPKCISGCEQELEQLFKLGSDGKTLRCIYCETAES